MGLREQIVKAFDVSNVSETYSGKVQITDLRDELGTKGHVLVVRGDKAYSDRLSEGEADIATPKLWLYENLINSPRVQAQLQAHPDHKLFDGVGFSSLAALGYHAKQIGRKPVVVMAREHVPTPEIVERYGIETISAIGPAEEGYVKAQRDIIRQREDIIPLHQALYGAQALAPVGNNVVAQLEDMGIAPDVTFWSIASGSNLYGIGGKIKQAFPNCQTIVVEPTINRTLDDSVDFSNPQQVKEFARRKLQTSLGGRAGLERLFSGAVPLHEEIPNLYLLHSWKATGDFGFDGVINIDTDTKFRTRDLLKKTNQEYDWTDTTSLALAPAIELAEQGKNVLIMSYGKNIEMKMRDAIIDIRTPWIFRFETPAQKAAVWAAGIGWTAVGVYYMLNVNPDAPPIYFGP